MFLTHFLFLLFQQTQVLPREILFTPVEYRNKVAILDTGIYNYPEITPYLCNDGHYDLTNYGIEDTHGHGTNIAAIIVSNLKPDSICIEVIKFTNGMESYNRNAYIQALKLAVNDHKVKYINISAVGYGYDSEENLLIKEAIKLNKYVIVAAGNENEDLEFRCNKYPACYFFLGKYFRVVGNGESLYKKSPSSNYGRAITDWMPGMNVCAGYIKTGQICLSGTSQSTAKLTNTIIRNNLKMFIESFYNINIGEKK